MMSGGIFEIVVNWVLPIGLALLVLRWFWRKGQTATRDTYVASLGSSAKETTEYMEKAAGSLEEGNDAIAISLMEKAINTDFEQFKTLAHGMTKKGHMVTREFEASMYHKIAVSLRNTGHIEDAKYYASLVTTIYKHYDVSDSYLPEVHEIERLPS